MSQKRILIFGYAGSTHIFKWSHALKSRGYLVRVVSLGDEIIDGIDVVTFPKSGKFSYFTNSSKAVKAAHDFKPDIIHVHYAGGYGIWGLQSKIRPLVVSVWGSDIANCAESFFNKYITGKILKNATVITATSHSLLKDTISLFPNTSDKISVIPFGVKIPEKPFDFPNSETISAVYLKQLEPVYAPDLLIKAVALVKEKFPQFKLTMGGIGSMKDELVQLVDKLNLEETVSIIGFFDNSKIYDLIKEHHFLVMPSLKEGFGVAAVEAFACGRPVVATNVGGIPEIVTHNKNGILVKPNNVQELADAMIELISDRERMVQFGLDGYKVAKEKYDWEKSVDAMIKVYEKL